MTFGELWLLIERVRVSADLRVVYYCGRFGSPASRCTIYNGEDVIVNAPVGEIPTDRQIFIWDDRYTGTEKLREASPTAGTLLKILHKKGLIRKTPQVAALMTLAEHATKVTIMKEDGNIVAYSSDRNQIYSSVYDQVQRDEGLIPI